MKKNDLDRNCNASPGRGWLRSWAPILALSGLLLCSFSQPGGPPTDDGPDDSASDDETVGTLPSIGGGDVLALYRRARITRPSVYVQGPTQAVLSGFLAVSGDARALVQPMSPGQLRLVFLGDVDALLDRPTFHDNGLEMGIVAPLESHHVFASAAWAGRRVAWTMNSSSELPIAALEHSGILDTASFHAVTHDGPTIVRVRASAVGGVVHLVQRGS